MGAADIMKEMAKPATRAVDCKRIIRYTPDGEPQEQLKFASLLFSIPISHG
jgi:hypothetical protein